MPGLPRGHACASRIAAAPSANAFRRPRKPGSGGASWCARIARAHDACAARTASQAASWPATRGVPAVRKPPRGLPLDPPPRARARRAGAPGPVPRASLRELPDQLRARRTWRQGAQCIETYRFDHTITDNQDALNPRPDAIPARTRWQQHSTTSTEPSTSSASASNAASGTSSERSDNDRPGLARLRPSGAFAAHERRRHRPRCMPRTTFRFHVPPDDDTQAARRRLTRRAPCKRGCPVNRRRGVGRWLYASR